MNVLVICIDTLRWDHCSYNKAALPLARPERPLRTPNIDRLAARSTIFDRAVIGSFPTVPMRTDCFTGNVNFPRYDWKKLGAEEILLTEVLRDAGFHTGFVHDTTNMIQTDFGRGFHEDICTNNPPPGNPKPADMPFPVPKENLRQEGKERQQQMARMAHYKKEADWFVTRTMVEAAEWLERNARRDKWFLWVDTFEVHEVWHAPAHYIDLFDPGYAGLDYDAPNYGYTDIYSQAELRHLWARYAAEVALTDRWLGYLLDQMDAMDLWGETMVVFVSDHGMYIGEHRRAGKHTVAGPSDPWPLYEEVSHIPLLVWIPGLRGPKHVRSLVQPVDLPATIYEAANVKSPAIHGQSLLPLMTGRQAALRDVVFSSKHNHPRTERDFSMGRLTATTDRWTLVAGEKAFPAELYDLWTDPGQRRNRAAERPEIAAALQARAVAFLREQRADEEYLAKYL